MEPVNHGVELTTIIQYLRRLCQNRRTAFRFLENSIHQSIHFLLGLQNRNMLSNPELHELLSLICGLLPPLPTGNMFPTYQHISQIGGQNAFGKYYTHFDINWGSIGVDFINFNMAPIVGTGVAESLTMTLQNAVNSAEDVMNIEQGVQDFLIVQLIGGTFMEMFRMVENTSAFPYLHVTCIDTLLKMVYNSSTSQVREELSPTLSDIFFSSRLGSKMKDTNAFIVIRTAQIVNILIHKNYEFRINSNIMAVYSRIKDHLCEHNIYL